MNDTDRIARLVVLAGVQRDRDLGALAQAAQARAATRVRIEALRLSTIAPVPADPVLFGVHQRHRHWAEDQRRALNHELARQSADWHDARARAARSFGRAAVLDRIARTARRKATSAD